MSAPLSVVVITKNEESNIARCLESVAWAPDRVVVDAYSTDATVRIAESLGARIFMREWEGYAAQKSFAAAQANQEWVLSLDGDEVVTPELAAEIMRVLNADPMEAAFSIHIPLYFLGRTLGHYGRARHDPGHVRLFRKRDAHFDNRAVHEAVIVSGSIGILSSPMFHDSYPQGIRTYWQKIHHYARLEALARIAEGRTPGHPWLRAFGRLCWQLVARRGLLHGPAAWIWIAGQAYQEYLTTRLSRQRSLLEVEHVPERVALVHERLDQDGGAERVLWTFHEMYPQAPIFTSMWNRKAVPQFEGCDVRLTWMEHLPMIARAPRAYAALYPIAFSQLDLRGYDLVISLSSAFAKGIRTDPDTLHICYCFSPPNFVWRPSAYFTSWVRRVVAQPLLMWLRLWEAWGAHRPDAYVAMGSAIADRIRTYYGCDADVIPLGLDGHWFGPHVANDYFLVVSRLTEQKRIELAIAACAAAGVPLVIAGEGRDETRLRRLSGTGVKFLGHMRDRARMRDLYARATAVIVPGEGDFGLVPLEAQASGTPVIAYDAGGVRDTVEDGITGIRFAPQTADALEQAIRKASTCLWDHQAISRHAARFEQRAFQARFEAAVIHQRKRIEPAGKVVAVGGGDAY